MGRVTLKIQSESSLAQTQPSVEEIYKDIHGIGDCTYLCTEGNITREPEVDGLSIPHDIRELSNRLLTSNTYWSSDEESDEENEQGGSQLPVTNEVLLRALIQFEQARNAEQAEVARLNVVFENQGFVDFENFKEHIKKNFNDKELQKPEITIIGGDTKDERHKWRKENDREDLRQMQFNFGSFAVEVSQHKDSIERSGLGFSARVAPNPNIKDKKEQEQEFKERRAPCFKAIAELMKQQIDFVSKEGSTQTKLTTFEPKKWKDEMLHALFDAGFTEVTYDGRNYSRDNGNKINSTLINDQAVNRAAGLFGPSDSGGEIESNPSEASTTPSSS